MANEEAEWSEFEKRLGIISDSSSSSSSGTPNFDNLYVFTHYYSDVSVGYYLFHIDLNSPPKPSLEPILSWDHYLHDAFVVCGSTLYMFCGMGENLRPKLTMSTYDLATTPPTTSILNSNSVKPGPPMTGRKGCPVAVMIGDFTICVFGTILHYDGVDPEDPQLFPPCFELFDTRAGKWKKSLPEPMPYENLRSLSVKSYCVHRSCLIIETSKGVHGINVDHTSPQWVNLERITGFPFQGMWTVVGNYLFNAFSVMSLEERKLYPFATKALLEAHSYSLLQRYPNGVISSAGGVDDLCRVRVGFSHSDKFPNLFVDIVKFDNESVEKFGSELSEWHGIKSNKFFFFFIKILSLHPDGSNCLFSNHECWSAGG